jgi:hypothetical protein
MDMLRDLQHSADQDFFLILIRFVAVLSVAVEGDLFLLTSENAFGFVARIPVRMLTLGANQNRLCFLSAAGLLRSLGSCH